MLHSIISLLLSKQHVLLHGPGGTGKSHLIKLIHTHLQHLHLFSQLSASTGISALSLGHHSRTIHSWAGVGIADLDKHHSLFAFPNAKMLSYAGDKFKFSSSMKLV